MSTDWYTKLVLTVLAASAAFLAAQHLEGEPGAQEARFRIQAVPMARLLLRLDSETGQTWTTTLGKPDVWKAIAESPIEKAIEEEAAESAQPARDLEVETPPAPADES